MLKIITKEELKIGRKKRVWKQEEIDIIIDLYVNHGWKMSEIGKKFASSANTISGILKSNNIKNNTDLLTKPDKRNYNKNYFSKIDTEEKAYFLGLLFTDGAVSIDRSKQGLKDNNPRISLGLKESDKYILEKFKAELNLDNKLIYYKKKNDKTGMFRLSVRSKEIANDLEKYNIIPNKTYLVNDIPKIPEEFIIPFYRGLFDGDGTLYFSKRNKGYFSGFCSYSENICNQFSTEISKFISKGTVNKTINPKGKNIHIVQWAKGDTKKLCDVLYNNNNIHLARKYDLAMIALFEDKELKI